MVEEPKRERRRLSRHQLYSDVRGRKRRLKRHRPHRVAFRALVVGGSVGGLAALGPAGVSFVVGLQVWQAFQLFVVLGVVFGVWGACVAVAEEFAVYAAPITRWNLFVLAGLVTAFPLASAGAWAEGLVRTSDPVEAWDQTLAVMRVMVTSPLMWILVGLSGAVPAGVVGIARVRWTPGRAPLPILVQSLLLVGVCGAPVWWLLGGSDPLTPGVAWGLALGAIPVGLYGGDRWERSLRQRMEQAESVAGGS